MHQHSAPASTAAVPLDPKTQPTHTDCGLGYVTPEVDNKSRNRLVSPRTSRWLRALQYPNIFDLVKELDIENPFTPFTTSGFWTPDGLSTSAPVFSQEERLPALIGQFVYTNPLFRCAPATSAPPPLPPCPLATELQDLGPLHGRAPAQATAHCHDKQ